MRFIPAYAGNARRQAVVLDGEPVHPRIRGERPVPVLPTNTSPGSSPHTRGTPSPAPSCRSLRRFIPAYAGNAAPTNALHHGVSVHPRIRGERAVNTILPLMGYGSSPHTRGTRLDVLISQRTARFIPAYAGNATWS